MNACTDMATRLFHLFQIFLVVSLCGCFQSLPDPGVPDYTINVISHYHAVRFLDVLVTDNTTKPGQPHTVRAIQNEPVQPESLTGPSFGCPEELGHPFVVKVVMKDQATYHPVEEQSTDHVLSTKRWTGLLCENVYQLVIDEHDEMHLYKGVQHGPPYHDPMPEVQN